MPLQQGRIIEAIAKDPQGQNEKRRPFVIVSETSDIQSGMPFWVVSITGSLPPQLTDEYVLLPWERSGNTATKLTKRCAAVCS